MKTKIIGIISSLFLFLFCSMNTAVSQVSTPPLSPEEAEVVKPLKKVAEGWNKKDMELFMSAYHENAVIQGLGGAKVDKEKFKKVLVNFGEPHVSYDVEKIEIAGEKAIIECILKWGGRVVPRKFDLIKQGESWLIIGQWLR